MPLPTDLTERAKVLAEQGFFEFDSNWFRMSSAILVDANNIATARIDSPGMFSSMYFYITGKDGTEIKTWVYINIWEGGVNSGGNELLARFSEKVAETLIVHRTWMRNNGMVRVQGGQEGVVREPARQTAVV